ncbi:MAG TPA: hypothetical protein VJ836_00495 [Candidatus Saccharimonadales bacterium]|nr:hypothetical protein [Candidatus Saccharimonadales bacterium]
MIKKHSDDPDVATAARHALQIVRQVLSNLPKAETFDYGGHNLTLGEYGVCIRCTAPIAEAQQANQKLLASAERATDPVVKEHLELAAKLFDLEAQAAEVRAELHNGHGSENIVNALLGFMYSRNINDSYDHSHNPGN